MAARTNKFQCIWRTLGCQPEVLDFLGVTSLPRVHGGVEVSLKVKGLSKLWVAQGNSLSPSQFYPLAVLPKNLSAVRSNRQRTLFIHCLTLPLSDIWCCGPALPFRWPPPSAFGTHFSVNFLLPHEAPSWAPLSSWDSILYFSHFICFLIRSDKFLNNYGDEEEEIKYLQGVSTHSSQTWGEEDEPAPPQLTHP